MTRIYADDGETVLAEFALEKRFPIKEADIPKNVEDALLAIEDYRFYDHNGIDPYRIGGVAIKNFTTGKMEGGSTITQQLAKNLFLSREQTYTRKITEWMMALQIERFYTKRQILEMYMNYVFLGAGSYGFEAGARTYFGKPLKDLNLEEAALLAAIPKSPEYSPTRNMEKAKERRDIVLDQMVKYEKITQADADAAKAKPIKLATRLIIKRCRNRPPGIIRLKKSANIWKKNTRRARPGRTSGLHDDNVEAQKLATKAVREGLRRYDKGRGWRADYENILLDENNENAPITDPKQIKRKLDSFKHADWYEDTYEKGELSKLSRKY